MSEENTMSAEELRNITHPEKFDIQGHGLTELYTPNQVIKILEYYAQHVKPKGLTDDEIDKKVSTLDDNTHYDAGYVKGFESGSEWARDLIEGKQ